MIRSRRQTHLEHLRTLHPREAALKEPCLRLDHLFVHMFGALQPIIRNGLSMRDQNHTFNHANHAGTDICIAVGEVLLGPLCKFDKLRTDKLSLKTEASGQELACSSISSLIGRTSHLVSPVTLANPAADSLIRQ